MNSETFTKNDNTNYITISLNNNNSKNLFNDGKWINIEILFEKILNYWNLKSFTNNFFKINYEIFGNDNTSIKNSLITNNKHLIILPYQNIYTQYFIQIKINLIETNTEKNICLYKFFKPQHLLQKINMQIFTKKQNNKTNNLLENIFSFDETNTQLKDNYEIYKINNTNNQNWFDIFSDDQNKSNLTNPNNEIDLENLKLETNDNFNIYNKSQESSDINQDSLKNQDSDTNEDSDNNEDSDTNEDSDNNEDTDNNEDSDTKNLFIQN